MKRMLIVFLPAWAVACALALAMTALIGVLPIPRVFLFLSVAPIALSWTAVFLGLKRKPVVGIVLALVSLVLINRWCLHLTFRGLQSAEVYGGVVADSVSAYHDKTSEWPAALSDLPSRPNLATRSTWPFTCIRGQDGYPSGIAGLEIVYQLSDGEPWLSIWGRDFLVYWGFDAKRWSEVIYPND